jgi:hypothetical protein
MPLPSALLLASVTAEFHVKLVIVVKVNSYLPSSEYDYSLHTQLANASDFSYIVHNMLVRLGVANPKLESSSVSFCLCF